MRHSILLLCASALAAPAQIVSVGVKAGVPVTGALPGYYNNNGSVLDTGRWTIGPTIEFRLPYGFSVEGDALYRSYRLVQSFGVAIFSGVGFNVAPAFESFRQDTKAWDFPLLLKYRFGSRQFRTFVDAGYAWSHESSDISFSYACLASTPECAASNTGFLVSSSRSYQSSSNRGGPTGGIGVEFKFGKIKFAPEVRYTHMKNPTSSQVTVLGGFTF